MVLSRLRHLSQLDGSRIGIPLPMECYRMVSLTTDSREALQRERGTSGKSAGSWHLQAWSCATRATGLTSDSLGYYVILALQKLTRLSAIIPLGRSEFQGPLEVLGENSRSVDTKVVQYLKMYPVWRALETCWFSFILKLNQAFAHEETRMTTERNGRTVCCFLLQSLYSVFLVLGKVSWIAQVVHFSRCPSFALHASRSVPSNGIWRRDDSRLWLQNVLQRAPSLPNVREKKDCCVSSITRDHLESNTLPWRGVRVR